VDHCNEATTPFDRKMERIIKRGQPGSADDGAFFKHNPGRSYRVRLATTDEVEIAKLGCDEALPREQFWYVAMHQIKPGVRRRCFLGGSLKDWSTIEDPARSGNIEQDLWRGLAHNRTKRITKSKHIGVTRDRLKDMLREEFPDARGRPDCRKQNPSSST
jgi:hypothetical protein